MSTLEFKQIHQQHIGKISDKWSLYLDTWDRLFVDYKNRDISLLEIGIQNGGSLEIWSEYFPSALHIIGCDINAKCGDLAFKDNRIKTVIADANSRQAIDHILSITPNFDIVIDDGSHASTDIIKSFANYFPYLNDCGIYVVEDLHCSYWTSFDGGLHNPASSMAFFKRFADIVNYEHWRNGRSRDFLLSEFALRYQVDFSNFDLAHIHSIEFLNSLCIIRKCKPSRNCLGLRIIAGTNEAVTQDWQKLNGTTIQDSIFESPRDNGIDIFELYSRVKELKDDLTSLNIELDGLRSLNLELEAKNNLLRQELHEKEAQISSYVDSCATQSEEITTVNNRILHLNQLVEEKEQSILELSSNLHHARQAINAFELSTSWRVTVPLRAGSQYVAALGRRSRGKLGRLARVIYRYLPVTYHSKQELKSFIYEHVGFAISGTKSYQHWLASGAINYRRKDIDTTNEQKTWSASSHHTDITALNNVLIIDDRTPNPDSDSGALQLFNYIKILLALGYRLTFAPANNAYAGEQTEALLEMGVRCVYSPLTQSLEEHLKVYGPEYCLIYSCRPDPTDLFLPLYRQYAPQARIVFNTSDLHYVREMRFAKLSNDSHLKEAAEWRKRQELSIVTRVDCTVVVSQLEQKTLLSERPEASVHVISLAHDACSNPASFSERKDIIFVGGYLHHPNVDAVHYFASEIFPRIKLRIPDVRFLVVGSNPPASFQEIASADINIVGHVPDLTPYLDSCLISVNPLRYGAGVKGKIVSALAHGLPCVATTIAAEGMPLVGGKNAFIEDDPERFADAVAKIYSNEDLWSELSVNSLDTLKSHYSFAACSRSFIDLFDKLNIKVPNRSAFLEANCDDLDISTITSQSAHIEHTMASQEAYKYRTQLEKSLAVDQERFSVPGVCFVCSSSVNFIVDYQYCFTDTNGMRTPNWRERLVCPKCNLNNRTRASIHILKELFAPPKDSVIYISEQTTPLFGWMRNHYKNVIGSEFLGNECPFGSENEAGIRNESLLSLTLGSNSLDHILSFDVLEHIPDFQTAVRECYRCLKPGGTMIFSVPFALNSATTITRARINEAGEIEHLLPPEYHGDPLSNQGCLCFYHFGWDLLDAFKKQGFSEIAAQMFWSNHFGYLGHEQILFTAKK